VIVLFLDGTGPPVVLKSAALFLQPSFQKLKPSFLNNKEGLVNIMQAFQNIRQKILAIDRGFNNITEK